MMQGPMLRALLAERFKLQVHRGTAQVPVYALTVIRSSAEIRPAKEGDCIVVDIGHPNPPPVPGQLAVPICGLPRYAGGGMDLVGATMDQGSAALSTRTDRRVIDKTGMAGRFDIHLIWSGDDLPPATMPPPPPPPPPPGSSAAGMPDAGEVTAQIQAALQKLGLKLERAQGSEDVLIVDHVERPGDN